MMKSRQREMGMSIYLCLYRWKYVPLSSGQRSSVSGLEVASDPQLFRDLDLEKQS